jgi:hypothetical protein
MFFSFQPAKKHSKVPKSLKEICGFADVRCYACNINYIALLQATLLQVYHATVSYMDVGEGYIALHCTEPKLPGHIFRGDVNQTTAAIKTMEHYQTYPFFADVLHDEDEPPFFRHDYRDSSRTAQEMSINTESTLSPDKLDVPEEYR